MAARKLGRIRQPNRLAVPRNRDPLAASDPIDDMAALVSQIANGHFTHITVVSRVRHQALSAAEEGDTSDAELHAGTQRTRPVVLKKALNHADRLCTGTAGMGRRPISKMSR